MQVHITKIRAKKRQYYRLGRQRNIIKNFMPINLKIWKKWTYSQKKYALPKLKWGKKCSIITKKIKSIIKLSIKKAGHVSACL
jgi:hypothetical protein